MSEELEASVGLEALVLGVEAEAADTVAIDFSPYFKLPAGSVEFHFASPSTAVVFGLAGMARRIKTQQADWPEELLGAVGLLVLSCVDVTRRSDTEEGAVIHISPKEKKRLWIILPEFVNRISTAEFTQVMLQWRAAFPHLANVNQNAVEFEKN